MEIPKTTKAWHLPQYNSNLIRALISLRIEDLPLNSVGDNDVLIEVEAASINPSDLAFLQGGYQVVKKLPAVPGFEATGLVIAAGMNQTPLIWKKVSCFTQDEHGGAWAKHLITTADNCIIVDDSLNLHQAATLAINPLTAIGMMEMAKEQKSEALLINAAGGVVPSLLRLLAEKSNIPTINIFR
ncbi:MAG: alcohol dehydrogenase catalytic domain-containing protein, partial [Bacteroidales bacterium]|nr:alcohol dehydrogenase catalytic domain-containing protein [Bacteroidales bacterium]